MTTAFRTIINEAVSDGILTFSPFWGYEPERPRREQKFLTAEELTEQQADRLLRTDLIKRCHTFRRFEKDALLPAVLSYNVGEYRLLGYGKIPKSKLIRKLESGNRNIYS